MSFKPAFAKKQQKSSQQQSSAGQSNANPAADARKDDIKKLMADLEQSEANRKSQQDEMQQGIMPSNQQTDISPKKTHNPSGGEVSTAIHESETNGAASRSADRPIKRGVSFIAGENEIVSPGESEEQGPHGTKPKLKSPPPGQTEESSEKIAEKEDDDDGSRGQELSHERITAAASESIQEAEAGKSEHQAVPARDKSPPITASEDTAQVKQEAPLPDAMVQLGMQIEALDSDTMVNNHTSGDEARIQSQSFDVDGMAVRLGLNRPLGSRNLEESVSNSPRTHFSDVEEMGKLIRVYSGRGLKKSKLTVPYGNTQQAKSEEGTLPKMGSGRGFATASFGAEKNTAMSRPSKRAAAENKAIGHNELLRLNSLVCKITESSSIKSAVMAAQAALCQMLGCTSARILLAHCFSDASTHDKEPKRRAVNEQGISVVNSNPTKVGGLSGEAATTNQVIICNDPSSEGAADEDFDWLAVSRPSNAIFAPSYNLDASSFVAIIQAFNKPNDAGFSQEDALLIHIIAKTFASKVFSMAASATGTFRNEQLLTLNQMALQFQPDNICNEEFLSYLTSAWCQRILHADAVDCFFLMSAATRGQQNFENESSDLGSKGVSSTENGPKPEESLFLRCWNDDSISNSKSAPTSAVLSDVERSALSARLSPTTVPLKGIMLATLRSGQPAKFNPKTDSRFNSNSRWSSILIVPLVLSSGQPIGVLNIRSATDSKIFGASDTKFSQTIAKLCCNIARQLPLSKQSQADIGDKSQHWTGRPLFPEAKLSLKEAQSIPMTKPIPPISSVSAASSKSSGKQSANSDMVAPSGISAVEYRKASIPSGPFRAHPPSLDLGAQNKPSGSQHQGVGSMISPASAMRVQDLTQISSRVDKLAALDPSQADRAAHSQESASLNSPISLSANSAFDEPSQTQQGHESHTIPSNPNVHNHEARQVDAQLTNGVQTRVDSKASQMNIGLMGHVHMPNPGEISIPPKVYLSLSSDVKFKEVVKTVTSKAITLANAEAAALFVIDYPSNSLWGCVHSLTQDPLSAPGNPNANAAVREAAREAILERVAAADGLTLDQVDGNEFKRVPMTASHALGWVATNGRTINWSRDKPTEAVRDSDFMAKLCRVEKMDCMCLIPVVGPVSKPQAILAVLNRRSKHGGGHSEAIEHLSKQGQNHKKLAGAFSGAEVDNLTVLSQVYAGTLCDSIVSMKSATLETRLEALAEMSKGFIGDDGGLTALVNMLQLVGQIMPCRKLSFYLIDNNEKQLLLLGPEHAAQSSIARLTILMKKLPAFPAGTGLAGKVASTGVPVRINGMHQHSVRERNKLRSLLPDEETCYAAVASPVWAYEGDKIVGIIEAIDPTGPIAEFSQEDQDFLDSVANMVAGILSNKVLASSLVRSNGQLSVSSQQNDLMWRLANVMLTEHSLPDLCLRAQSIGKELLRCGACTMWICDYAKNEMTFYSSTPNGFSTTTTPISGIVGMVATDDAAVGAEKNSTACVPWVSNHDVTSHTNFDASIDQRPGFATKSMMCSRIIYRGEVLGVISFVNSLSGAFVAHDIERAKIFASQAGAAVFNAKLFFKTHKMTEFLSLLASDVEITAACKLVCETASKLVRSRCSRLFLVHHEKSELWNPLAEFPPSWSDNSLSPRRMGGRQASHHWQPSRLPFGEDILSKAAQTGRTLKNNNFQDSTLNMLVECPAKRNVMALPIKDPNGTVVAVLELSDKKADVFSDNDETALKFFRDQAGIVLRNAVLFDIAHNSRKAVTNLLDRTKQLVDGLRGGTKKMLFCNAARHASEIFNGEACVYLFIPHTRLKWTQYNSQNLESVVPRSGPAAAAAMTGQQLHLVGAPHQRTKRRVSKTRFADESDATQERQQEALSDNLQVGSQNMGGISKDAGVDDSEDEYEDDFVSTPTITPRPPSKDRNPSAENDHVHSEMRHIRFKRTQSMSDDDMKVEEGADLLCCPLLSGSGAVIGAVSIKRIRKSDVDYVQAFDKDDENLLRQWVSVLSTAAEQWKVLHELKVTIQMRSAEATRVRKQLQARLKQSGQKMPNNSAMGFMGRQDMHDKEEVTNVRIPQEAMSKARPWGDSGETEDPVAKQNSENEMTALTTEVRDSTDGQEESFERAAPASDQSDHDSKNGSQPMSANPGNGIDNERVSASSSKPPPVQVPEQVDESLESQAQRQSARNSLVLQTPGSPLPDESTLH